MRSACPAMKMELEEAHRIDRYFFLRRVVGELKVDLETKQFGISGLGIVSSDATDIEKHCKLVMLYRASGECFMVP